MAFRRPSRALHILASALAATGTILAVASCSHITPLGPDPGYVSLPPQRHLGSPITVQVMRSRPPTAPGACPAGWLELFLPVNLLPHTSPAGARPIGSPSRVPQPSGQPSASVLPATTPAPHTLILGLPCYQPVGKPVTITSAAVSSVVADPVPPGQPKGPTPYGFTVGVPAPDVAAVTALIAQAFDSHAALGVSVGGKLWEAAQIGRAFSGQQLEIAVLTRSQAVKLYRLLIPPR
jgi:hypothetical protein